MTSDERLEWEKAPNETGPAFAAFVAYRDLGVRRSIKKAVPLVYPEEALPITEDNAKVRTMKKWSSANSWVARANAFDEFVEQETRLDQQESVREMRRRHATVANMAVAKAAERLRTMSPSEMSVSDATRLLDLAVKVERVARGEPNEIRQVSGPDGKALSVGIDGASVDALEARIRALIASDTSEELPNESY
jgi:hypothetical protein